MLQLHKVPGIPETISYGNRSLNDIQDQTELFNKYFYD